MCKEEKFWSDLKSGKFASMVQETGRGEKLASPAEVYNVTKPLFAKHKDVETVLGIFLDTKNRILAIETLFSGSIAGANVYPREIVKRILELESNALVLIHNHPSGCTEPSRADYAITVKIMLVLEGIGVSLHDHSR